MPIRKLSLCIATALIASAANAACDPNTSMCATALPEDHKASPVPAFSEVPVPVTDEEKRKVVASSTVTVDGKKYDIGFHNIMRSGDKVGEGTFGLIYDKDGNVVKKDGQDFISVDNDFTSLLPIGDKLFMVSQFETRPAAMYLTELEQDKGTGKLTAKSTKNIDFSKFGGLWVPCAGSVTPWNTHLGSEEYPSNARSYEEAKSMDDISDYTKGMIRYFGFEPKTVSLEDFRTNYKPYRYGYPTEIKVSESGDAVPQKHFAMGRVAVELAKVMPDARTAYISDDGTNVGLYMFVADSAGDLSAGNLYAAKWNQVHAGNGGYANLEWVNLGHASNDEIQEYIESGIQFSDIFETANPANDGSCTKEGFTSVNTTTGNECLKVKPGMQKAASRLETRRYSGMKGATTEFRKEEGITLDKANNRLYVAMSAIGKGMETGGKYNKGNGDHIQLPKNKCGVVYGLDLVSNLSIGSDYVAKNMYGVVVGKPHKYAKDGDYAKNKCDINGIANPDNVTFIDGRDTLIIGEDTGSGHQNDYIWSFNTQTQGLTRILTTPYGAETTSPYFYPNINGFSYLTAVVQHPYGESDEDKAQSASDKMGYTGYVGPMPAMEMPKKK